MEFTSVRVVVEEQCAIEVERKIFFQKKIEHLLGELTFVSARGLRVSARGNLASASKNSVENSVKLKFFSCFEEVLKKKLTFSGTF